MAPFLRELVAAGGELGKLGRGTGWPLWVICSLRQSPCPATGCPVPSPGTNTHLSFHCFPVLEGEGVWAGGGSRGRGAPAKGPVSSACPCICLAETGILTSYKGDPVSLRRDPQLALLAARSPITPEHKPHSVLLGRRPSPGLVGMGMARTRCAPAHTHTDTHAPQVPAQTGPRMPADLSHWVQALAAELRLGATQRTPAESEGYTANAPDGRV